MCQWISVSSYLEKHSESVVISYISKNQKATLTGLIGDGICLVTTVDIFMKRLTF